MELIIIKAGNKEVTRHETVKSIDDAMKQKITKGIKSVTIVPKSKDHIKILDVYRGGMEQLIIELQG